MIYISLVVLLPSQAQTEILELEKFVATTVSEAPQRIVVEARYQEALAESAALELKQNPAISTQVLRAVTSPRELERYQGSVSISQPLRPSDLGTRSDAASKLKNHAQAVRASELISLSYDVALLYTSIWQAQTLSHEYKALETRGAKLRTLLSDAVEKGLIPPGRFALFEAELGALTAEAVRAESLKAAATAELLQYGTSLSTSVAALTPDIPNLPPPSNVLEQASSSHPSLQKRLELAQSFAKTAAQVAEEDRIPTMTPSITYQYSPEDIHQVGVGLSFPLPFFNPNRPERMSREAQEKRASANAQIFSPHQWSRLISAAFKAADLRRRELKVYETDVLPKLEQAFDQFEQAVRQGGGELFDLWQVLRSLREMKAEVVRARRDALAQTCSAALLAGHDIFGVSQQ